MQPTLHLHSGFWCCFHLGKQDLGKQAAVKHMTVLMCLPLHAVSVFSVSCCCNVNSHQCLAAAMWTDNSFLLLPCELTQVSCCCNVNSHLSALACAALSTHAGRNQRALPDKRARRKPGWLDNSVDPKAAAQPTLPHATGAADVSLAAALPVRVLILLC